MWVVFYKNWVNIKICQHTPPHIPALPPYSQTTLDEVEPGLFKLKPYRSKVVLEELIRTRWPSHDWTTLDADWKYICNKRIHVHRRLLAGECPILLIPDLVPYSLEPNGKIIKELLVAAKMGQKYMWWSWTEKDCSIPIA